MPHPTWELKILDDISALILTPCPGTKELGLIESLQQLKDQGAVGIVTALSLDELEKAGVADLPEEARKLGLEWFHQPIVDDQDPGTGFDAHWDENNPKVQELLQNGGKIALHCMGGSGRTGLLAAHILLEQGWTLDNIKQEVKTLRPTAFTKKPQIEYIERVADEYS